MISDDAWLKETHCDVAQYQLPVEDSVTEAVIVAAPMAKQKSSWSPGSKNSMAALRNDQLLVEVERRRLNRKQK